MFTNAPNQRLWATTDVFVEFPDEKERIEAYNEHADANLWETKTEEDQEVSEFIQSLTYEYWDEKFEGALNLEDVVVTGYFGAWNGPKEIYPCFCKNLEEAIEKCCSIHGDWGATVYFERDEKDVEHLIVDVVHHDGRCRYEISLLDNPEDIDEEEYELKPISHEMIFGA